MWEHCTRTELESLATLYRAALGASADEDRDEQQLRDLLARYSVRLHEQSKESEAARVKEMAEALGPNWREAPKHATDALNGHVAPFG